MIPEGVTALDREMTSEGDLFLKVGGYRSERFSEVAKFQK